MIVETLLAHTDDDGHFIALGPGETVDLQHLFLEDCVLQSVRVMNPERPCLDVDLDVAGSMSASWSGLFFTDDTLPIGCPVRKGSRVKVRATNISQGDVFVRMWLGTTISMRA